MNLPKLSLSYLRQQTIGIDQTIETPYGDRIQTYCDYTASGRGLVFVERYIQSVLVNYANTHTEDDRTGQQTTRLFHQAESCIKSALNAGQGGRIINCGAGATAAITKLQEILGVRLAPATQAMLLGLMQQHDPVCSGQLESIINTYQPVIFIGPYEHHSNEVTWRESLATVVEVDLDDEGCIDLTLLERLLQDPQYQNRLRIGSFSAASNVTGMRSPVDQIAILLHRYNALACFDFAASAPYVEIDMNPPVQIDGDDPSIDAVYISPHKFIGGPGSSGVLVFNERIYPQEMAPTVAGGGTVDYVSQNDHDFIQEIETRESAGTPGILQTLRAALAFEIKQTIGTHTIEQREHAMLKKAFSAWSKNPAIEIMGNTDPTKRVGIVSFNLRSPDGLWLHPKFVTRLLSDLFGLQTRAGCSCAGPYGHRLLGIDQEHSQIYRRAVNQGCNAIKPGWCRLGFHYTMDDTEVDYIIQVVDFVARYGHHFLTQYEVDLPTGAWIHQQDETKLEDFSLTNALGASELKLPTLSQAERARTYQSYLDQAHTILQDLEARPNRPLSADLVDLQFFRQA